MRWLDENLMFVSIPYLFLGLGVAFAPFIEAGDKRADDSLTGIDIVFIALGHLVLFPIWLWLYKRYGRAKNYRVRLYAFVLPAASYALPVLLGIAALMFTGF